MKYNPNTFIIVPNKMQIAGKLTEIQVIYMWLCNFIDKKGDCYPSRRTISKLSGCSVRSVDKYLKILEEEGLITKKNQIGSDGRQTSNLYNINLIAEEGANLVTTTSANPVSTPSVVTCAQTQPYNNSTILTHITEDTTSSTSVSQDNTVEPTQDNNLPLTWGKTYILRLGKVYKILWKSKYGTVPESINLPRFGKALKPLVAYLTEYQITALLLCHFNWYGASGTNDKEYKFLSDAGFPIELVVKNQDIYVAYLTNVLQVRYTNLSDVKTYVIERLTKLL